MGVSHFKGDILTQQIPADANDVIDQLSQQIGTLSKQNAILSSQLAAAMKLIPQDVLDAAKGVDDDSED